MNEKQPHPSQSENNPPPSIRVQDWQEQRSFYGSIGLPPQSKPTINRPPLFPQAPPIDPSRVDRTSATSFPILPQQSLSVNALPHDGVVPFHQLAPSAMPTAAAAPRREVPAPVAVSGVVAAASLPAPVAGTAKTMAPNVGTALAPPRQTAAQTESSEMAAPLPFKASELISQVTANGYIVVKNAKYLMRVDFLHSDFYSSFNAPGCHAVETKSETCCIIEQRMPDFSTRRIEKRVDGIKEMVRDRYGRVLYEFHVDALGYWSTLELKYHDAGGKISPFVSGRRTVNSGGIVKETAFGRQGKPSGTFEWDYSK